MGKNFVIRGLGLGKNPKRFFFVREFPVRKTQKIAPDNAGLLQYCFEDKKGVLRTGYGCNCKKIAGEGFWRPEDLNIYEYIVQDCEDKNRTV